jgi:hypothetical protein
MALIRDQDFIHALREQKEIVLPLEHLKFIEKKEFDLLSTRVSYIIINNQNQLFKKEEGNNENCYFVRHGG